MSSAVMTSLDRFPLRPPVWPLTTAAVSMCVADGKFRCISTASKSVDACQIRLQYKLSHRETLMYRSFRTHFNRNAPGENSPRGASTRDRGRQSLSHHMSTGSIEKRLGKKPLI